MELARAAGADLVLDLARGGKVAALNAAVERARGEVLAFSDANATGGRTRCAARRADSATRASATPAARSAFSMQGGVNQEGVYWRYEMGARRSSPDSPA